MILQPKRFYFLAEKFVYTTLRIEGSKLLILLSFTHNIYPGQKSLAGAWWRAFNATALENDVLDRIGGGLVGLGC